MISIEGYNKRLPLLSSTSTSEAEVDQLPTEQGVSRVDLLESDDGLCLGIDMQCRWTVQYGRQE